MGDLLVILKSGNVDGLVLKGTYSPTNAQDVELHGHNHDADYDAIGAASTVDSSLTLHKNATNPHSVSKITVGLSDADNTSDMDKPVSTATTTALTFKENSLGNPASDGYVLTSTSAGVRSWVAGGGGGVSSHSLLTNLNSDDHAQYHTDTRGDLRYYTHSQLNNGQLDNRYYTETETNSLLTDKSNVTHNHDADYDAIGAASTVDTALTVHKNTSNNPHMVTTTQIGLSNVDNTSDANKPISTATQTALNNKEDGLGDPSTNGYVLASTSAGVRSWVANGSGGGVTDHTLLTNIGTNTHAQIDLHLGDATKHFTQASISITESQISDLGSYSVTGHTHVKADVGLSNADNTSDANKPISTATQTALNNKAAIAHTHTESDITDLKTYVQSDVTSASGAIVISNAIKLTQAQYDVITPNATTLYVIAG